MENKSQGEIIGLKVKQLRQKNHLTLKQLSEKINLSISFLSQVERGRVTVGIKPLEKLSEIFGVDMAYFFTSKSSDKKNLVVRSYEREFLQVSNNFIQYSLSRAFDTSSEIPQIFEVFPNGPETEQEIVKFKHDYDEHIYVLEGVLDLYIEDFHYMLQPGDCAYIPPNTEHKWMNNTLKMVKLISINSNVSKTG